MPSISSLSALWHSIPKPNVRPAEAGLVSKALHAITNRAEAQASAPRNPLTRFFNHQLYGSPTERQKIQPYLQKQLDADVQDGLATRVTLQGQAGRLEGYLHSAKPGEASGKVVLFLHGSHDAAETQAHSVIPYHRNQGADTLVVNGRGFGQSDGTARSSQALYDDAYTMYRHLVDERGILPENITVHAYSLGGPEGAEVARRAAAVGESIGGLLLDRPMPSMAQAVAAKGAFNPFGIGASLAKAINGQFSVERNMLGVPTDVPVMLLTDNEGLGAAGEGLRGKLAAAGFSVSGERMQFGHVDTLAVMDRYSPQIAQRFLGVSN